MSLPRKITGFEAPLFNFSDSTQLAEFKALLAQDAAGLALLAKYQEDDIIKELLTGMSLRVVGPRGTNIPRSIIGENCQIKRCTVAAGGSAAAFAYVKATAGLVVSIATVTGEAVVGVALNDADQNQAVYVMTQGTILVREGATPPTVGGLVTTDNSAKTKAGATTNWTTGQALAIGIVIGTNTYSLVTLGQLVQLP